MVRRQRVLSPVLSLGEPALVSFIYRRQIYLSTYLLYYYYDCGFT